MNYENHLTENKPIFLAVGAVCDYHAHCHNEIEIYYCFTGSLSLQIEDAVYTLTPGCAAFVSSLYSHAVLQPCTPDTNVVICGIGPHLLRDDFALLANRTFADPILNLHDAPQYPSAFLARLRLVFERIQQEFTEKSAGYNWAYQSLLLELAYLLIRYAKFDEESSADRIKKVRSYLSIRTVFDYVEKHYSEPIGLDEVAALIGYEKKSFCRLFGNATNTSFHQYLMRYRINIAKGLLDDTALTISEIGVQVGFPIPKHFTRAFHTIVGVTPTTYRKRR